ncbi:MAG: TetR/AcrR family transcriptional regulator [Hyphomicrobium sp.]
MGRKSSLNEQEVYRVVACELATTGRFTVDALNAATGLSMGSIYHRFGSREGLLAETWLNAVERFQAQFLDALAAGTLDAGLKAALVTPRFCRSNPNEAMLLACCRQAEFLGEATPAVLRARIAAANNTASGAVRRFAKSIDRPLLTCRLALIAYPLGAVRLYLPKSAVPHQLDVEIIKAARSVLA